MGASEVAIVAAVVLAYAMVSGRLDRSPVTAPMVFAFAGLLLGDDVAGVVDLSVNDATVRILAEATLVLVLFSDAARIDLKSMRSGARLPGRLLGIGFPLTLAAGLGVVLLVFPDFSVWEAGLLAVILTPTDAALGQAVVSSRAVPVRVRQALNVESGLNDGLAVPLLAIAFAGAATDLQRDAGFWLTFVGEQLGYGLAIGSVAGLAGGYGMAALNKRQWINPTYGQIAPLSVAALAFGAASAAGGNGFLAAFVAGLTFGSCSDMIDRVVEFAEEEGQLFAALTFFLFGAVIAGPAFEDFGWRTAVYATLSLTLIRVVPVAVSLVGTGLRFPTVGFLGWFGPRGLASIIFAIEVAELGEEIPAGPIVASVVTCVVFDEHLEAPDMPTRMRRPGKNSA